MVLATVSAPQVSTAPPSRALRLSLKVLLAMISVPPLPIPPPLPALLPLKVLSAAESVLAL